MKLYDYTTGALAEVTPESLADEYVMAHFIPQVPSAYAAYCAMREGDAELESVCGSNMAINNIIRTIETLALTALPGEVK